jgi:molybdopterin-binding protein
MGPLRTQRAGAFPDHGNLNFPFRILTRDMGLSQHNRFPARVASVQTRSAMHHIMVQLGEVMIEAIITRDDAEKLNLKAGDSVVLAVKPTDIVLHRARGQAAAATPHKT